MYKELALYLWSDRCLGIFKKIHLVQLNKAYSLPILTETLFTLHIDAVFPNQIL